MSRYSKRFLIDLYHRMVRIRICEESFVEPILNHEVRCPVHLYSGEEAVAVGICAALNKKDHIFGTHRSHGHYLAKGGDIAELIAEIYGKVTGCSRGRGGSMHLIAYDKGMLGTAPIVAGTISLALGAALASKIKKEKRVTVSFFGDGATGEGVLFESLNFSALKKLPIIFACENNFYSTHMPIRECRPRNNIFEVAKPFGIKSFKVDGNDVIKVYEISKAAVESCRKKEGPVFIEFMTYRLRGHVGPDDNIQGTHADIRAESEIKEWRKKDPVKIFRQYLIKNTIAEEKDLIELENQAGMEVEKAHTFAKNSPFPEKNELSRHVFK